MAEKWLKKGVGQGCFWLDFEARIGMEEALLTDIMRPRSLIIRKLLRHLRRGQLPSAKLIEVHRLPHLRVEMWATRSYG